MRVRPEIMGAYINEVEDGRQQLVLLLPPPRPEPFDSGVRTSPSNLIRLHKRVVMSQDVVLRDSCQPRHLGPGPAYASNSREEARMSPSANARPRVVSEVSAHPNSI